MHANQGFITHTELGIYNFHFKSKNQILIFVLSGHVRYGPMESVFVQDADVNRSTVVHPAILVNHF